MSEDFEKLAKEALGSSRSPTAKAIILMSMQMDNMKAEMLTAIKINKQDTDIKIEQNKQATDKKFDKLSIPLFLADNPKMIWLFFAAMLVILGVNDTTISYIKNIFIK